MFASLFVTFSEDERLTREKVVLFSARFCSKKVIFLQIRQM